VEDQAYEDPRARPTSVPAEIFKLFLAAMERIFWDREVPQGPVIAAVMIIIHTRNFVMNEQLPSPEGLHTAQLPSCQIRISSLNTNDYHRSDISKSIS
jgi:hypothetical protein